MPINLLSENYEKLLAKRKAFLISFIFGNAKQIPIFKHNLNNESLVVTTSYLMRISFYGWTHLV